MQNKKKYDWLVVGAGLAGATFANIMQNNGKNVLVIDKRFHVGGNCYTFKDEHILVHYYGPHIFHTSNKNVMQFVKANDFACERLNFINCPKAINNGKVYSLPFNMNTFSEIFGVTNPKDARNIIDEEIEKYGKSNPSNLEEKAISMVGKTIYDLLIKDYTEKQWGRPCYLLSPDIITRLPLRFTFNNNYYNDDYQFTMDYTRFVENLLHDCDVKLMTSFEDALKSGLVDECENIYYTGSIDELCSYFGCGLGGLKYRTVREQIEHVDGYETQGNAVINYTGADVPYTRVIEHKLLSNMETNLLPINIISKEFPEEYDASIDNGIGRAYPIQTDYMKERYTQYVDLFEKKVKKKLNKQGHNIVLGGRLALYSYMDMDDTIEKSMEQAKNILVQNHLENLWKQH